MDIQTTVSNNDVRQQESKETAGNESVEFMLPQREVKTLQSLVKWNTSKAYKDVLEMILGLNIAIKNRRLTEECHVSQAVSNIVGLLDKLSSWIDEIPACEQPQRFGNKSFRVWSQRLVETSKELLESLLPAELKVAVVELQPYLTDSFGNSTRIDYGTGHELSFFFFLCSLYKLRILTEEDQIATVCKIFTKYLEVARKLQQTYRMEPAGSQGVWGLDDHQFLPYIWGSGQLVDQEEISPAHIPDIEKAKQYQKDYMFFDCLVYINSVKTGPFAEHSNTLWGISAVPYWSKVNSGLIKMYKNEVLSKFPIIQHLVFGSIMSIEKATKTTGL